MELKSIVTRTWPPVPWDEGGKIPWNEPSFSERMLHEHLTQDHNLASRRTEYIDSSVEWVHSTILNSKPSRILDLGCGPGLFLERFARLGHSCVGIDFSPASVNYAREITSGEAVEVIEGDLAQVEFGEGFDVALMLFGEINVFRPEVAKNILRKCRKAAKTLVVEYQHAEGLLSADLPGRRWEAHDSGLFSLDPHLLLTETNLDENTMSLTTRFIVVDLQSSSARFISQTDMIYRDDEWEQILHECGWQLREMRDSFGPADENRFSVFTAD